MDLEDLKIKDILNALPDITYIVDRGFIIRYFNFNPWSRFAIENKAPELAIPSKVLGKNILNFISGEDTIDFYSEILNNLSTGKSKSISFPFKCDSPKMIRQMRMTISPILFENSVHFFLFHSIVVSEIERPEAKIFEKKKYTATKTRELVFVCSYCKNIHFTKDGMEEWLTPEEYKFRGGNEDVTIVHKICNSCNISIIRPMIKHSKQL
jgi:hypothetical protein